MTEMWDFPEAGHAPRDLVDYDVEARDGSLGRVERQETVTGRQHLIVDTGAWLFGSSVLVPAGAVETVDPEERRVTLLFAKDEVKDAPRFTTDQETHDPGYLATVDSYYERLVEARESTAS